MTENDIAKGIIDAAVEVHRELGGPGLRVGIYEEALAEELKLRGLKSERQPPLWLNYKGRSLSQPVQLGMKVEGLVLMETKAGLEPGQNPETQMLTYLRLTGLKLGVVINFAEQYLKNGIYRVAMTTAEAINFKPQLKRKNPKDGQSWKLA